MDDPAIRRCYSFSRRSSTIRSLPRAFEHWAWNIVRHVAQEDLNTNVTSWFVASIQEWKGWQSVIEFAFEGRPKNVLVCLLDLFRIDGLQWLQQVSLPSQEYILNLTCFLTFGLLQDVFTIMQLKAKEVWDFDGTKGPFCYFKVLSILEIDQGDEVCSWIDVYVGLGSCSYASWSHSESSPDTAWWWTMFLRQNKLVFWASQLHVTEAGLLLQLKTPGVDRTRERDNQIGNPATLLRFGGKEKLLVTKASLLGARSCS